MKPFSLHAVLSYRKTLENIAQHRLFEAKKIHETIEQKLESEKTSLLEIIRESEQMQVEGIPITELIRYEERITFMKGTIKAIEKTLLEKAEIFKKEQKNLLRRSKEHQIMKRLREQQDSSWQAHLDKKEAAMLDEIAILRHDTEPR